MLITYVKSKFLLVKKGISSLSLQRNNKTNRIMKTKFKLLTWNTEDKCIFSREFKYENEAIEIAQALSNRRVCPHNVIGILKTKETGHRWQLVVWHVDKPSKMEYALFYSKKDATFATKLIRKYDNNLKTCLTKYY